MENNFAPKSYFDPVINKMKSFGFELMAWVTMSTPSCKYHVPVRAASESRLFFHIPNKTLIVMLEYTQIKDIRNPELDCNYWSGMITMTFSGKRMYIDLYRDATKSQKFSDEPIHLPCDLQYIEGYFRSGMISGYSTCIEPETWKVEMDPEKDLEFLGKIANVFGNYCYEQFIDLQVTSFAPHYTFIDQEKVFWSKFPLPRLRNKVKDGNIWGSDFA